MKLVLDGVGCKLQFKNERHVTDIRPNLISSKVLDIKDYHTYFNSGDLCKIPKRPLVVAKEKSRTCLYKISTKLLKSGGMIRVKDASNYLGNTHLGHFSEKGLTFL